MTAMVRATEHCSSSSEFHLIRFPCVVMRVTPCHPRQYHFRTCNSTLPEGCSTGLDLPSCIDSSKIELYGVEARRWPHLACEPKQRSTTRGSEVESVRV